MRILLSLLLSFVVTAPAFAVVDMKNANFADTWTDMVLPGTGFDLRVRRTYNSRSLLNGMFGFGWCSDFETSIDITAESNLKLTECGGGLEVSYFPKNFNKKEVEQTVVQIMAHIGKTERNPKTLAALKQDLMTNEKKRTQLASEAGVKSSVKDGSVFYANGQQVETITLKDNFYVRSLPDGTSQKFDSTGKLAFVYDKNGNYLKMSYAGKQLKEVIDNNGRKLSFKYNPTSKKLAEITGPRGLTASYTFSGEDLTAVTNAWKNRYTYKYDGLHNITRLNFPDGTFKALTYNEDKDWVTSFTDRFKCVETYSYDSSEDDPKNHYTSKVEKKCKGEVTNFAKYEFWHKERQDGSGKILARVKTETKNDNLDITYHETFGRPLSIIRNNNRIDFTYLGNGLVKTKTSKYQVMTFDYDKDSKKISEVKTEFKDDKGKIVRTRKTNFKYDDKGNLSFAANTDGQQVWLTYDARGRIATIRDQAKKTVTITYEEKYGKPSVVTRPGLGTILVSYNSDGQIDKVDSKQGPTVAVQVASTFNNLLDVIAPATNEASI